MDNRELEKKIKASYDHIAPDILDSLLTDCDEQKGKVIVMQEKKNKKNVVRYIAGLAAALLLVCGGLTGRGLYRANIAVASRIMLDVNPSIEIELNKNEKVLGVNALNEDAKIVVGDMDFSGSTLDVTVNALIGSMLRNGYISDAANSILVSVDSTDAASGQAMQEKLMGEINQILESSNVSGAVLAQTVSDNSEIRALAEKYDITEGKVKLIQQIVQQNTFYTFEELVPLTINELNLISESGGTKLDNIASIGTASASAYVDEQTAMDAAFTHAGVSSADAEKIKCKFDWENGAMVYEIDFDASGVEYEYEVNATTGAVVKFEKETAKASKGNKINAASVSVEEAAAKNTALAHAGAAESEILGYSCELDHEHGVSVYEIEFDANGFEYDYDINAETGAVVKYSKKADKNSDKKNAIADGIGADAAKEAALAHAGVSAAQIYDYECEAETKHGSTVYEISFDCDGYEYEYNIDAASGEILKSKKERD